MNISPPPEVEPIPQPSQTPPHHAGAEGGGGSGIKLPCFPQLVDER